ncbi:putative disease resistance protein At3g14460 [Abrus precatorius]|uniref:Disease resistance protein At3g14460 n=1 Tax=Abrus precatorius TaxID=3816 RepID=A0A8B8K505_ABRPR|nr:putative disease resistance protein At3g14460 [Abrus precatorius]
MGGIGKTTLAQLVYNDDRVKHNFVLTAWVYVSEEFNVSKIIKAILEAITSQRSNTEELDILLLEFKKMVSGKKFLFILDDIWNENYVNWDHLRSYFFYGAQGSAIVVTTRSEKVASFMQTVSSHRLGHLSDKHCWDLLAKHAFGDRCCKVDPVLERIGKDIVKKCQGLPLAVKTLGGLLRSKPDVKDWDIILKNDIWNLLENECQIIPALRISYYYLPPCLKRCFAYCSMFPKDYEFDKEEPVLVWMAENFLQPQKGNMKVEDIGNEYFFCLVSRSFFQSSSNKKECFVMHHLMHDLAKFVAGEFCLASEADNEQRIPQRTRHLSYDALSYPVFKNFLMFCEAKHLRTFLPIYSDNYGVLPLHERVPHLIFTKLRCLRVLSLSGYGTIELLPDSIGELIHLRYLDLSRTKIKLLPDSVCGLYNLQTLKLTDCFYLTTLPEDFFLLVNLRYLDIRRAGIEGMPTRIGELKSLQFLSDFIIGKETRISELGELEDLTKSLAISRLENTQNSDAKMKDKKFLEHLEFSWSSNFLGSIPLGFETKILHNLQPQMNLKSLSIRGYPGSEFPVWIGHNGYHNMVSLSLHCCDCSLLPPLGQPPSLKHLLIHSFHETCSIGPEFFGTSELSSMAPFASLETLIFSELEKLLSFQVEPHAFQQLREFELRKCTSLVGDLHNSLPALKKLVIIGCNNLVSSLPTFPMVQEIEIHQSENIVLKEIPISLHSLRVSGSNVVDSVFMSMMQSENYLEHLEISDCFSTTSFSGCCLPNSLKTLEFKNCKNFEVHMFQCHTTLESYKMQNRCDLVESFPVDMLPVLKCLHIEGCENLASLLVAEGPMEYLDSIAIIQCPKLVSFHELELYAPRLRSLTISRCENMLPNQMQSLLPTLTELSICDCPEIESFPEMGLPSSLSSLVITNCLKLTALRMQWNLPSTLTSLTISGIYEIVESFPEDGLLPDTLTYLSIEKVLMLKLDCKKLQYLTSLKYLWIVNCPMLESMTEASLPCSLIKLTIRSCPFLEEKCRMKSREIWPKIAHIRNIRIGDKWMS